MLKKVISLFLVSAIIITTSISSEIITYASCFSQNKTQLEDEIKLVDKLQGLKSPAEIFNLSLSFIIFRLTYSKSWIFN